MFRSLAHDTDFQAHGFYDYGNRADSLHLDRVSYTLRISPTGAITGSSRDTCGPASIEGTVDWETHAFTFTKAYGFSNLWASWTYTGKISKDGMHISGSWGRGLTGQGGRYAIWLVNEKTDNKRKELEILLLMHGETMAVP